MLFYCNKVRTFKIIFSIIYFTIFAIFSCIYRVWRICINFLSIRIYKSYFYTIMSVIIKWLILTSLISAISCSCII